MRRVLLVLGALAALAAVGQAADPFTLDDFLQVPVITTVAVSPDGQHIAWVRTARDLEDDERSTELWLADKDGEHRRRLTWDDESVGSVGWRPDGALCFLRGDDDGDTQVWINPLDGSEPRPVTDVDLGIQGYWWSPDGAWLAVLAPRGDDDEDADADETPTPTTTRPTGSSRTASTTPRTTRSSGSYPPASSPSPGTRATPSASPAA